MHGNDHNNDDVDSESDFGGLFATEDPMDAVFYFRGVDLDEAADGSHWVATFTFNFHGKVDLRCTTTFAAAPTDGMPPVERLGAHVLAIGLCMLPWYWMGFATPRIVVERQARVLQVRRRDGARQAPYPVPVALTSEQQHFWNTLYGHVLLEYMYVNKLDWPVPRLEVVEGEEEDGGGGGGDQTTLHSFPRSDGVDGDRRVLLPLGGGKDSLVAWHLARQEGLRPTLMYVCDGAGEYGASWRLRGLVRQMATAAAAAAACAEEEGLVAEPHLVQHVFANPTFERHARSYLTPCGHPWAALVLFDAALVCAMTGVRKVYLGHEKSADYGNGRTVLVGGQPVEINHQYDKSGAFLTLAASYVRAHLDPTLAVESRLRDMWELHIARTFCTEPDLVKMHPFFISCNEPLPAPPARPGGEGGTDKCLACGGCHAATAAACPAYHPAPLPPAAPHPAPPPAADKNDRWCGRCEKCAFVCLLLSAWMPPRDVDAVFASSSGGADTGGSGSGSSSGGGSSGGMLHKEELMETFLALVGAGGRSKPFECVGTAAEAGAAAHLAAVRHLRHRRDAVAAAAGAGAGTGAEEVSLLPPVLRGLLEHVTLPRPLDADDDPDAVLAAWGFA